MSGIEIFIRYLFFITIYAGLCFTIFSIIRSLMASSWPVANGKIIYSTLDEDCDSEGCTYKPAIEFRYEVKGRQYSSKRFAFGFVGSSLRFLAATIVNRFRVNSEVKVYHHPRRPDKAVLLVGLCFFHLVYMLIWSGAFVLWGPWFTLQ